MLLESRPTCSCLDIYNIEMGGEGEASKIDSVFLHFALPKTCPMIFAIAPDKICSTECVINVWLFSPKVTTLLYYLIHALLPFLAGVSKDNR